MKLQEETTSDQATRPKSSQLCHANGSPLNPRVFAASQHLRQATSVDSFLGERDRAFLSRSSRDGCLPAAQTSGGLLPLQRAIALGDFNSLELALTSRQAGNSGHALTRACNAFGETLLHTAVLHQQLGAVQLLLKHGASPLTKLPGNSDLQQADFSVTSTAPRTSNFRYSRVLSTAEATPLHYACATGHIDILKYLLLDIPPSKDTAKHWRSGSLLLWAITSAQSKVVEFLVLQSGLEADCFDEDENNSIAIAALVVAIPETPERLETFKTIVQVLVQRGPEDGGADVNHTNTYGLSAFDVAETPALKQILAQFGAMTARVVPVERVLRWDRDRFRDEIEYTPSPGRCRVILREQSSNTDN